MHFLTIRPCWSTLGHGHFNMFVQLRCSSQITPKYLTLVTRFMAEPLIETENWFSYHASVKNQTALPQSLIAVLINKWLEWNQNSMAWSSLTKTKVAWITDTSGAEKIRRHRWRSWEHCIPPPHWDYRSVWGWITALDSCVTPTDTRSAALHTLLFN